MHNILGIIYGVVFGIANIIPGVSGGTMLVIFGCYDKVCGALSLDFKEIKKNIKFLIFFGIGAALGIVGFSNIISFLFDKFPTETYMFFIGLILGSIPLIIRSATVKEKFKPICAIPFIIALGLVVGLTLLEKDSADPAPVTIEGTSTPYTVTLTNNSDKKITNWHLDINWTKEDKENHLDSYNAPEPAEGDIKFITGSESLFKLKVEVIKGIAPKGNTEILPGESVSFKLNTVGKPTLTPKYSYEISAAFIVTVLAASFLAAVAMIVPGVSGSFIMVLLGTYATVINAVKEFDFAVLIPTAIGVLLGLVLGARLIRVLLKKFRLMVFSAILGLCVGSLFAILPEGFGFNLDTLIGVFALAVGGFISFIVGKNTNTNPV